MNFAQLLAEGGCRLREAGIEEAEVESRLLLEAASGKSRTELYLCGREHPSQEIRQRFADYIDRRCRREPTAYILQQREFWSLPFYVNRHVLIPRPETEFLLEMVFRYTAAENFTRGAVLDLCTGSGAIGIVLARESAESTIIASDISLPALAVAAINARSLGVANRFFPLCGDLLHTIAVKSLSLVVSNPPYIITKEMSNELAPEVRDFEPHSALDGGDDGLVLIRRIEQQLRLRLRSGGDFFMEFGADQGDAVIALFSGKEWTQCRIFQDYAGRDRVLWARKA